MLTTESGSGFCGPGNELPALPTNKLKLSFIEVCSVGAFGDCRRRGSTGVDPQSHCGSLLSCPTGAQRARAPSRFPPPTPAPCLLPLQKLLGMLQTAPPEVMNWTEAGTGFFVFQVPRCGAWREGGGGHETTGGLK